jgi:NAD(P)-dependent dehydrogenase (short-subunit alcohol dehydrogenase family)
MTEMRFDGRVAIITGAGGGLGRAHALAFARRGAMVVVNDLGGSLDGTGSSSSAAERVVAEIEALGGHAVANHDSVATAAGGQAIVDSAVKAFGRVDIVVNNAGILRDKAFHKMDASMIDAVIDVHLKGAMFVSQPAFALMRAQGYGRIVNTTSASGLFGNFGQANYGAAKAGLFGLTRVLALEGAERGIKVNAIAPLAATRMTVDVLGDLSELVTPESVSPVVLYLAHEDCSVNGHVYSVAGGRVARIFVAETIGAVLPELTPEDVRDNLAVIEDTDSYLLPGSLGEATEIIGEALGRGVLDAERV